jgi:hypothetical protein
MDTDEGDDTDPLSLHKYLYASGNPANRIDPSGNDDIDMASLGVSESMSETLDAMAEYFGAGPAKCTLGYKTVSGGPSDREWDIDWKLSPASLTGGAIVQQVWIYTNAARTTLRQTYWEAWIVSAGAAITLTSEFGAPADDTSRDARGVRTDFCAMFYSGIFAAYLEDHGFAAGKVDAAGQLYSTPDDPQLPTVNTSNSVWRTHNSPN